MILGKKHAKSGRVGECCAGGYRQFGARLPCSLCLSGKAGPCQWLWVLRAEVRAWHVLKWVGLLSVGAASDLELSV